MMRLLFLALSFALMMSRPEGQHTQQGTFFQVKKDRSFLDDEVIWSKELKSLMLCSQMCARKVDCKSANFMTEKGSCSLLGKKKMENPAMLYKLKDSIYLEKVGVDKSPSSTQPGTSAVISCQSLHSQSTSFASGVYLIDPDGGSQNNAFKAYCDMETDGGGWTLVWSYKFTNYKNFDDDSNAVTPRPNWPANLEVDVPISTSPPLNETDYNAIDFSLWKQLGQQVLIKSNINSWLVCHPGTGSLVDWQDGSVNCHFINNIARKCSGKPGPVHIMARSSNRFYGPMYTGPNQKGGIFIYFDGSTKHNWPTHDRCGKNRGNHLQNVANPHGNIFIR